LGQGAYWGGLLGVLVLGVFDQTAPHFAVNNEAVRAQFTCHAAFINKIEAALPSGAMIFQLPYFPFPETLPLHRLDDYDHGRPYIHSRTLRWSYPTMKGRETAEWQRAVTTLPPEQMVGTLAAAGFQGIYLDRNGFADGGHSLEAAFARILHTQVIVSSDNQLVFFKLGEYGLRAER
jgi:phosphoglycerol transferase